MVAKINSQEKLALQTGVSQGFSSKWCRNLSEPNLKTIAKILNALGVPVSELIPGAFKAGKNLLKDIKQAIPGTKVRQGDGYVTLPLLAVSPSANHGAITEEEVPMEMAKLQEDWLQTIFRRDPRHIINPNVSTGIYAIRLDGALLARRVRSLPDDRCGLKG
ncbi:MAG: helix-turn-helix transcriptional regulator [Candidatus Ozemobacteraceae bacterium]